MKNRFEEFLDSPYKNIKEKSVRQVALMAAVNVWKDAIFIEDPKEIDQIPSQKGKDESILKSAETYYQWLTKEDKPTAVLSTKENKNGNN